MMANSAYRNLARAYTSNISGVHMGKEQILQNIGLGAAAGLIGTAAMQAVRTANQKIAPETMVPMREEPGRYMVDRAEDALPPAVRPGIGEGIKNTAATLLALGYGSTGAAVYSALQEEPKVLRDGALLGLGVWSIGYLGWLPALKLAPKPAKQTGGQLAMSIAQHLLYGIATVGAYQRLRRALEK